ncbi:NACHT domain-containing protein [Ilyonectria robusta]
MRDRHLDKAHRVNEPPEVVLGAAPSEDERVAVLKALIRANKLVEGSAAKQVFDGLLSHTQQKLLEEAASCGTYEMMELLVSKLHPHEFIFDRGGLVVAALKSENRETLRWIQAMSREEPTRSIMFPAAYQVWVALLESEDPEGMYHYVETWLYAVWNASAHSDGRKHRPDWFERWWIKLTHRDYLKETLLISFWSKLYESSQVPIQSWSLALCAVANTTRSMKLAGWLCRHGATVNYVDSVRMSPPLILAARKDTLESALLMRFLLYKGADPECPARNAKATKGAVSELKGPSGLHKWLKISWEELIEEAKEARRNSDNPPVPID